MENIIVRPAHENEAGQITRTAYASKNYWNYPSEYFDVWEKELTITPQYIRTNTVFVAEYGNIIAGFCSITTLPNPLPGESDRCLDCLFIHPDFIGRGIGSLLLAKAKDYCTNVGIRSFILFSDPNARGFYEKYGAVYLREAKPGLKTGRFLFTDSIFRRGKIAIDSLCLILANKFIFFKFCL